VQMVLARRKGAVPEFQSRKSPSWSPPTAMRRTTRQQGVVVEYEPLAGGDRSVQGEMDADAPVLREDLAGKTTGAHGPRKTPQPCVRMDHRRQGPDRAAFNKAEVSIKEMISYHRTHPSP